MSGAIILMFFFLCFAEYSLTFVFHYFKLNQLEEYFRFSLQYLFAGTCVWVRWHLSNTDSTAAMIIYIYLFFFAKYFNNIFSHFFASMCFFVQLKDLKAKRSENTNIKIRWHFCTFSLSFQRYQLRNKKEKSCRSSFLCFTFHNRK